MDWIKRELTPQESASGGMAQIQGVFEEIFMKSSDRDNIAMFSVMSTIYIQTNNNPVLEIFERAYSFVPSEAPTGRVSLLVGRADAHDMVSENM